MKKLILLLALVPMAAIAADDVPSATAAPVAAAPTTAADFDSLGGNQPIYERAKAISSEKTVSIVQNRTVSRVNRVELAPEFSGTFGGNSYNETKGLGLNVHYHINPHWSVGAKYDYLFNTLTPEGKAMVSAAEADYAKNPVNPTVPYPYIDYPKSEMMALVNWYPFYGKLNLMDKAVAHFDVYALGGYGQVQLLSGTAPTYTGGMGVGFWISNHFTTRIEGRYQSYNAKGIDNQTKKMDLAVTSLQMGYML